VAEVGAVIDQATIRCAYFGQETIMATGTGIEWTQITWNPTTGCDRVSAGCDQCYALALARRLKAMGAQKYQHDGDSRTSGPGFGVSVHEPVLREPYRWAGSKLVFVNSMSDLFHARIPAAFIRRVFAVMAETPQHTYQVLTKRSVRLRRLAPTERTNRRHLTRVPDRLRASPPPPPAWLAGRRPPCHRCDS
jgi:protein gp37